MFRKLHFKLTAYMGLILIVFMIFIATGIYSFTRIVFEDGNRELMESEAVRVYTYKNVSYSGFTFNGSTFFQRLGPSAALIANQKLDACYVIYDYDDDNIERIFTKENEVAIADTIESIAVKAFEEKKDSFVTKRVGRFNYRIYTKYFNDLNGQSVVQVYQSTVSEEIIWSFLKTVLFVTGISGTAILLAISYMFTGQAIKPIKDTWVRQKAFVADASHELRTPLTVIQTNLDVVLSDEEGTVQENEMWLGNAYSETRVMAKLIDELLILAKADANEEKLDISEFSFSEIVENVCQNMEIIAKKKNVDFQLNLEEDVIIKADYDKIRRLVVILVDNAVKYTEKGKVTVSLYTDKNKKVFAVEDTGIGICKKDIDRIFDRFYRADKARHREGGTGLGLSIAKWIADVHKFSLTVESTINVGSKFTVRM
ncbi:MAG: HAMP domain-containing sensor histidine kinase [Sedimentibacter sp.]|uniref:sensor histidine kinase n=1 Tax=Sedimentibacter sp. TaxID=1960295 RepID=UPI00298226F2|nr:HAMP domain-containing sensor histidine kinase [Sedimentibacter sp.]MDW5299822.1 HAMP domain-containing sensor histidine kinase [Sedimentibacter sp.]